MPKNKKKTTKKRVVQEPTEVITDSIEKSKAEEDQPMPETKEQINKPKKGKSVGKGKKSQLPPNEASENIEEVKVSNEFNEPAPKTPAKPKGRRRANTKDTSLAPSARGKKSQKESVIGMEID
jgi:hypothetical protein